MLSGRRLTPLVSLVALVLALLALGAQPAVASQTFTVNDTGDNSDADTTDNVCDATGAQLCTMRAAIDQANVTAGTDTIWFSGPAVGATIGAGSALPAITETVAIDGCSGAATPSGPCVGVRRTTAGGDLFDVLADGTDIRGLALTGSSPDAIFVPAGADGLTVQNNWFGIKLDGSADADGSGIDLRGATTTIGGTTTSARNVFGNNGIGIAIRGGDSNNVRGNYVGVKNDGSTAAPNDTGIRVVADTNGPDPATGNTIGATVSGPAAATTQCDGGCNVISESTGHGIDLEGDVVDLPAGSTVIQGNFIGLDSAGGLDRGNGGQGIHVAGVGTVTIGGASAGPQRNYIGGNTDAGIGGGVSGGSGPFGLDIENNVIGLGSDSQTAIPDGNAGASLSSESGDPLLFEGNRVGGNGAAPLDGLLLTGSDAIVDTNKFGFGLMGVAHPIALAAIKVQGSGNTIGAADVSHYNVIANTHQTGCSVCDSPGILIDGTGAPGDGDGNIVTGNVIGTYMDETTDAGNDGPGIRLAGNVDNTQIGGDSQGEQNAISFNGGDAVEIADPAASGNLLLRNHGTGNGGIFYDLGADGTGNLLAGPNLGAQAPAITVAGPSFSQGLAPVGAGVRVFSKASAAAGEVQQFLGQATANASGNWTLTYNQGDTPVTLPLQDGQGIVATQTPASNNTSELSVVKLPAADPPQTKIKRGPSGSTTDRTPRFRFHSDESGSTFRCRVDGKRYRRCSSPKTLPKLSFGRHVFRVKAKDKAGNSDTTPAKRTFRVIH